MATSQRIKFLAEIGEFAQRNSHDRMSGGFELRERGVVRVIFFAIETQMHEKPIFAIARGIGRRLFIRDGNDALPFLAGAFRDQLPEPDGKMVRDADAKIVVLSRPARAASPRIAPSEIPGLFDSGTLAAQASCIVKAQSSRRCKSTPMIAAGTRPKCVSAE